MGTPRKFEEFIKIYCWLWSWKEQSKKNTKTYYWKTLRKEEQILKSLRKSWSKERKINISFQSKSKEKERKEINELSRWYDQDWKINQSPSIINWSCGNGTKKRFSFIQGKKQEWYVLDQKRNIDSKVCFERYVFLWKKPSICLIVNVL